MTFVTFVASVFAVFAALLTVTNGEHIGELLRRGRGFQRTGGAAGPDGENRIILTVQQQLSARDFSGSGDLGVEPVRDKITPDPASIKEGFQPRSFWGSLTARKRRVLLAIS